MTLPLLGQGTLHLEAWLVSLAPLQVVPGVPQHRCSGHARTSSGAIALHGAARCWMVKDTPKLMLSWLSCLPCRWLFHCHIFFHQFMGQAITFNVAPDQIAPPPTNMVQCPAECTYNFGSFNKTIVATNFADSGLEVPLQ